MFGRDSQQIAPGRERSVAGELAALSAAARGDGQRSRDVAPARLAVNTHAPGDRYAYPRGGIEREGNAEL